GRHGMDDLLGLQAPGVRDASLAGRAAADLPTLLEDRRSPGAMDRTVHPPAAEKRRIRRIDDGIGVLPGDVSLDQLDTGRPDGDLHVPLLAISSKTLPAVSPDSRRENPAPPGSRP